LSTYTKKDKKKWESSESLGAKKIKSSFKKRKSVMLLFGDQVAARKVIYEQVDEEESSVVSVKSVESLPLRKARNISRAIDDKQIQSLLN